MSDDEPARVVRPTMRCLLEDLAQEVGPPSLRQALRTASHDLESDETFLLPVELVGVEHLVIDKANLIATDAAAVRDRIEALRDRHVVKVKTADRRAALWMDDEATWWLLAAGRRKDDGPGDFYRELERFSADSTPIAPTARDRRYLRLETAYAAECHAEREAQGAILGSLLSAASSLGTTMEATVFGAIVSVRIEPDEGDEAVLEMSWQFDRFDEQGRFPYDVLAMVPGRDSIDLWEYLPPRADSDSPHAWFTYVSLEWVAGFATAVEVDQLLGEGPAWTPTNPVSDGSEHFSHYAGATVVTLAYVTGIEIVGLCGARVVAHRDYEALPVCVTCLERLELLRQRSSGDG